MRKNPLLKRLLLSRETIAVLSRTELQAVAGAEQPVTSQFKDPKCSGICPSQVKKKTCGEKDDDKFMGLAPPCPLN